MGWLCGRVAVDCSEMILVMDGEATWCRGYVTDCNAGDRRIRPRDVWCGKMQFFLECIVFHTTI